LALTKGSSSIDTGGTENSKHSRTKGQLVNLILDNNASEGAYSKNKYST